MNGDIDGTLIYKIIPWFFAVTIVSVAAAIALMVAVMYDVYWPVCI
jgi:hypothetical protein